MSEKTIWHNMSDAPTSGSRIVAIYNDGSGASCFIALDGSQLLDADGYELSFLDIAENYGQWAYLPDNMKLWCEIREHDPVTLP